MYTDNEPASHWFSSVKQCIILTVLTSQVWLLWTSCTCNSLVCLSICCYKPVNHLVGGAIIKGVVKAECLVLQVAGEVHFLFRFMNHHHVLTRDGDHIQILHGQLWNAAEARLSITLILWRKTFETENGIWLVKRPMLLPIEGHTFLVEWTFPYTNTYSVLFNLDRATKKDILLYCCWGSTSNNQERRRSYGLYSPDLLWSGVGSLDWLGNLWSCTWSHSSGWWYPPPEGGQGETCDGARYHLIHQQENYSHVFQFVISMSRMQVVIKIQLIHFVN